MISTTQGRSHPTSFFQPRFSGITYLDLCIHLTEKVDYFHGSCDKMLHSTTVD